MYLSKIETDVDEFIEKFLTGTPEQQEFLRSKFRGGYCYYFAHMLQTAFERGLVCWTAPFGHFVWVDTGIKFDKFSPRLYQHYKAYDIEGRYNFWDNEVRYLIPEQFLGKHIYDFLHSSLEQKIKPATKHDLFDIIETYKVAVGIK